LKKITDFRPQRKNANRGKLHGVRLLEKSVQSDGWIGGQTAAANHEMIGGSKRLELAAEKFPDVEPIIVESDGSRPVIVVRTDIPNAEDPRARRLSVADNQIAATDWNPDGALLAEWAGEDEAIRAMFSDSEWVEVTGEEKPTKDAEPQTDRAAELLEKWQVKTGDLWQIGDHRLICGDCTDPAVVARVMGGEKAECMWTDPPYGVEYVGKTKDALTIENDGAEDLPGLLTAAFMTAGTVLIGGAPFYVAHPAGALQRIFLNVVGDIGWKIHEQLVWVKDSMVLGHADYHYKHEPILYGWTPGAGRPGRGDHEGTHWYGDNSQTSVFCFDRPKRSAEHPTMKPPELVEAMLRNSTQNGDTVYEPFSGSGTTLVACENLSRRCRAVEISPAYVAVALERMSTAFPDLEIRRLP
jgi:DNA modification methylase